MIAPRLHYSPTAGMRRGFLSRADVEAYEQGRAAHRQGQPKPEHFSPAWQGWTDAECEQRAARVEGFAS